jgi:hypothetical protein
MSKKLKNLLENEIKRFNTIIAYQDNLGLNEVSYRFYNEVDDVSGGEPPLTDTEEPITDEPATGDEPTTGVEPAIDGTEEQPVDNMDTQVDPAGDMPPTEDEEVTEVDVTDLVNDTNEIKTKIGTIEGGLSKIDGIISKVDNIENGLSKMDSLIGKMEMLAKQVELMRPPTEEERRKALANDSYPFSVTLDQYNSGVNDMKTQTDLEQRSKMSMLNSIMNDYNDVNVANSFNVPQDNPFKNL